MIYEMEDLVPIVGKLAEKYTCKESSSISYEKAQQLMEAVIYCIHEAKNSEKNSLEAGGMISACRMYEIGVLRVEEKVKDALSIYNEVLSEFSSYENICLYDTFVIGLPEFFKWYDYRYEPQNTILTLDYPVLMDISEYTGIDKIFCFIQCIYLEQKFLRRFTDNFIKSILIKNNVNHKEMIDNICEIVLMTVTGCILIGKHVSEEGFETEEYECMQKLLLEEGLHELQDKLNYAINQLVAKYYDNDGELSEYLSKASDNIAVRLKNAAVNGNLKLIL